ncbi:MAG TPA: Stp1/IreP family PP2C-type Ser/Thr phosphatase [Ruminococcaceae bacterium]|nr:Stp1/IreP family PP2C-type Ser/Thr phosphatase [Oscillospiraceae bacterium]
MKIITATDKGKVRHSNEDYCCSGKVTDSIGYAVVCDGMGGERGGNIASKTAVEKIEFILKRSINENLNANSVKAVLFNAVSVANSFIYDMAKENPELRKMGTTVVAAVVIDNGVYIAHAGDSRLYKINKNEITQLTKDHSVVQILLDQGEITDEQAANHPKRHYITRALGAMPVIDIEYSEYLINEDDVLMICTDGLYNHLDKQTMAELTYESIRQNSAQPLINAANSRGGNDNITVAIITR